MLSSEKPRVVFLPLPGIGHFISTVEAARRVLEWEPRFSATVLTLRDHAPTWAPVIAGYIDSLRASSAGLDITFEELPPVEDPPQREGMHGETFISLLVENTRPHVRAAIARLVAASHVVAVVIDLFSTTMIDVAEEFGLPSYIFFTSTAAMIGLMLRLPALDVANPAKTADMEGDIEFPGFRHKMPSHFLPCFMTDKKNEAYKWMVHHGRQFRRAKGLIVNTFAALEPGPLQALDYGLYLADHPTPPVYPIGPLLSLETRAEAGPRGRECLSWLDGQPPSSVVYLCFGSRGCFPAEQTKEIAVGLERSGLRFLWALRNPSRNDADSGEALPEGFLERTKGRGLVWPAWAPQADVLAHPATGGFVTHCGWNSCLESLWCGVPMLAWPLSAEQHLNAFEMAREVGVAVGVLGVEGGLVSAEEVERGVTLLMGERRDDGRKGKGRAEELKAASRAALEPGGESLAAVVRLASDMLCGGPARPGPLQQSSGPSEDQTTVWTERM